MMVQIDVESLEYQLIPGMIHDYLNKDDVKGDEDPFFLPPIIHYEHKVMKGLD